MGIKMLIFDRYKRLFDQIGNFFNWGENTAFLREFINNAPLSRIDTADGRRGILRQLIIAGQIAAINPKHRANRDGHENQPQRHKAENRPKK